MSSRVRDDDQRFWIMDPAGHRRIWAANAPEDGAIVDTFIGQAVAIVPPAPDPDEWICDFCNEQILTRWGDEPFPVPMDGSYALCGDHYNTTQTRPRVDEFGEDIPGTRQGMWPPLSCGCDACRQQTGLWLPYFKRAHELTRKEVAAQN